MSQDGGALAKTLDVEPGGTACYKKHLGPKQKRDLLRPKEMSRYRLCQSIAAKHIHTSRICPTLQHYRCVVFPSIDGRSILRKLRYHNKSISRDDHSRNKLNTRYEDSFPPPHPPRQRFSPSRPPTVAEGGRILVTVDYPVLHDSFALQRFVEKVPRKDVQIDRDPPPWRESSAPHRSQLLIAAAAPAKAQRLRMISGRCP